MTDTAKDKTTVQFAGSRAAGWKKWFPITDATAQPVSDRMVALAGVGPGSRVLDIGTGLGEPAITAARAVGPAGHVLAADISPEMLDFAQDRARQADLANLEFRVLDANALDLPEASFDAVLSRWGLMFLAALDDALAGIRRCLKPGGRLVAVVWGPPEGAPTNSLADRVLRRTLKLPPPEEGPGTPFALKDTDAFVERVRKAGFRDIKSEWIEVLVPFEVTCAIRRIPAGPRRRYQEEDGASFTRGSRCGLERGCRGGGSLPGSRRHRPHAQPRLLPHGDPLSLTMASVGNSSSNAPER